MPFRTLTGAAAAFVAASAGTGTFTVAAVWSTNLTPEQAQATDGGTYSYYAQSADGSVWEYGSGVYTYANHTLTRATISTTSNGDQNTVNFASPPIVGVLQGDGPGLTVPFPSGTQMLFCNATAPVGWTRVTTYDDCAIRLVGTNAPTFVTNLNPFSVAMSATRAHALTISEMPSHNHALNPTLWENTNGTFAGSWSAQGVSDLAVQFVTTFTGGSAAHTHNIQVNYVDFIMAKKN